MKNLQKKIDMNSKEFKCDFVETIVLAFGKIKILLCFEVLMQ